MVQRQITQQELATALGVSRQAVQRWQAGIPFSTLNLIAMCKYFGVSASYLLGLETSTGEAVPSDSGVVRINALAVNSKDSPTSVRQMMVDATWLASVYPTENPETLAIHSVRDDTMKPTLKQDDVLLVDTDNKGPADGLFVVKLDNATCVRRLQRLPGRQIRVICDNPNYDRMTINGASGVLQVLGRVVYFWNGNS